MGFSKSLVSHFSETVYQRKIFKMLKVGSGGVIFRDRIQVPIDEIMG